jgi:hypothetical protein
MAATRKSKRRDVSSGNPCPFLRALVAEGLAADDVEPVGALAATVAKVARAGEGQPHVPQAVAAAIAAAANGLGPLSLLRNATQGVRLNALRGGPLDKRGVGSRLLNEQGEFMAAEFERLEGFASLKTAADGRSEPGVDSKELRRFMDANFERAKGQRRRIDRALMDGEWPILLKVMGRDGAQGRYLSVAELETLFAERRLPERMRERMGAAGAR